MPRPNPPLQATAKGGPRLSAKPFGGDRSSRTTSMIWTAWNNGRHHTSGAGYGFKVAATDRDRHFQRDWDTVIVELPEASGLVAVEVNIAKDSFWSEECREVIHQAIGRWLRSSGYAPWPQGSPPQFEVEPKGVRRFVVRRRVQPNRPPLQTDSAGG